MKFEQPKRFKTGDRVHMKGKGFGTVREDTYNGIFHTYTPVKWDNHLGQNHVLAERTQDLELVKIVGGER